MNKEQKVIYKVFKEGQITTYRAVKKYTDDDKNGIWWDWLDGFNNKDVVILRDIKFIRKSK